MDFTIKLADGSTLSAYTVQEIIRVNMFTQANERKLSVQGMAEADDDMDQLGEMLNKEGNISEISIYDGSNKITAYTGYNKVESITKTLQATTQGWKFIIDILLAR